MAEAIVLPETLQTLLKKIAAEEGLTNTVEIVPDGRTLFFEGFTSTVYFITIKEANTNKILTLVAKLGITNKSSRLACAIEENYFNECLFYTELWPIFNNMQVEAIGSCIVDLVPKCYHADPTKGSETLVLSNLKTEGYVTFPRADFYDREHLEVLFKVYGQFHALSIAFRCKNPQSFSQYEARFREVRVASSRMLFQDQIKLAFDQCYEYCLDETDDVLNQKLKMYCDNLDLFFMLLNYKGDHPIIAHGDCWSNNLLFKYNEEKIPTSLKLIDFQDMNTRSVVHDLSYNFYSGAASNELKNLTYYLRQYHSSLCVTLDRFKISGHKVYPFNVLQAEWKIFGKFGFIMSLLLTKLKFAYQGEELALSDILESDQTPAELEANKYDLEKVKLRYHELVTHLYQCDYL